MAAGLEEHIGANDERFSEGGAGRGCLAIQPAPEPGDLSGAKLSTDVKPVGAATAQGPLQGILAVARPATGGLIDRADQSYLGGGQCSERPYAKGTRLVQKSRG